jgi:DNA-binding winged helix-turn-helix (wHTH) protein/TolB-like protein
MFVTLKSCRGRRAGRKRCYRERVTDRVAFGLFELDPATGTLTREGRPIRLQPQPARVLAILVGRAGEVVPREDLRRQIWTEGTYVDFERGLNFCIAQIRNALGDSAESPRFIETVPKRGYRFIAPVRSEAAAFAAPVDPVTPTPPPPIVLEPRRRQKSWVPIAAASVLAAIVGVFTVTVWRATPADRRVRIAVVPFDNETGLDDFDRIARGVADATVARLATPERVARLSVIGNAAELYQPRAFRDLRKIGLALDAEYVVLAQMKRDTSGVRLIAHLIRVSDESHLWANTYDRPAFTLEVQGEIAESIATAVLDRLGKRSSPRT